MQYPAADQTEESLLALLPEDKPVFIDFYATWCEPCKYLDEILAELESRLKEKVVFLKLDVDQQAELSRHFQIRSVPTLMIYKNGMLQWRMSGFKLAHELEEDIRRFL